MSFKNTLLKDKTYLHCEVTLWPATHWNIFTFIENDTNLRWMRKTKFTTRQSFSAFNSHCHFKWCSFCSDTTTKIKCVFYVCFNPSVLSSLLCPPPHSPPPVLTDEQLAVPIIRSVGHFRIRWCVLITLLARINPDIIEQNETQWRERENQELVQCLVKST